ncbi:hemagglutinin repeat-containing protein [uncultured Fusobacterium sp.]|uniref:two-partner secretion domain-containing protein n=1 Tax=uncultured Fusobacterium sp. TaxID=159267 RepID=UPI0025F61C0A|nr:hemagglutinin repeat-containing protein [uncultured Fusobacterium sp.]
MNYLKRNEKILKHNLKNKRRITLSLIVAFLITGQIGFIEEKVMARDLRTRNKGANEIKPHASGGPSMTESANGTDVIQITNPNSGGISHNKFIDFSVGAGNGVIFNNNATKEPVVTKIGGIVVHNPNLNKAANAILTEVTGNKGSNINGTIEIAGQKADFILANENGVTVNGGGFINTSGVTLTTGKPTISGSDINLNVQKGNVLIDGMGVGTAGNYFNIVAKTIELKGQVAPFDGQMDADITLIAGQNDVTLKNSNKTVLNKVIGNEKDGTKYGIYANKLGSMYGKNIKLISTTEGLGVRHEGLIRSSGDIEILSNGDITVGGVISEKDIKLKGEGNLTTLNGSYKNSGIEYNYSIFSGDGVELDFKGDITLESFVKSDRTEIKIVAKNLTLKANSTAKILSQKGLSIKVTGTINLETLLMPVMIGRDPSKPPLVVLKDSNGKIIVKDPETGRILNTNEIEWQSTGIFGKQIDIMAGNLINNTVITSTINSRENDINIDVKNQLTNNNLISAAGNLDIKARKITNNQNAVIRGAAVKISAKDIVNKGELRQNTAKLGESVDRAREISIDIQNGTFTNTGIVSGYNVKISGNGFVLNDKNGKIEASTEDYPLGMGSIDIDIRTLENKGIIQSYGEGLQNNITINTETLTNAFGAKIVAKMGTLKITSTVGDLLNSGEFFADKDLVLLATKGNIKNSGLIGGNNITATAEKGLFENYGKVAAVGKLMIHVNNLINAGTPEEITKYLSAFNSFVKENYDNVVKIIAELEKKLESTTESKKIEGLEATLSYYKNLESALTTIKYEIDKVGALGFLSGNDIEIKSNDTALNKGIIKSNTNITLKTSNNLTNNGVIEGDGNVTLKATNGDIKNTQRIYAGKSLDISGKSFISTGSDVLLGEYADLMQQYNEKELEEAEDKIKELEKKLDSLTDKAEIEKVKADIAKYRTIKTKQSEIKAKIITIAGLGIVEAGNVSIEVTGRIENDGIIITDKDFKAKAEGDIINNGNIAIGGDADISGYSFINKFMTVGENLISKVKNTFESDSLKVQKDIKLEANNVKINKELYSGANADITLSGANSKIEFSKDSTIDIKDNLNIKGGTFVNNGEVVIGKKLSVNSLLDTNSIGDKSFKNIGSIDAGSDIDIKSQGVDNKGDMLSGGKLTADAGTEIFNTESKLQAKNGASIKSNGFKNTGEAIFGGNLDISAGSGEVENTSLEVKGDTTITTTSSFINTEKLQNTGNLTVNAKSFENIGNVLNSGLNVTVTENIKNTNKIEVDGNINLKGTGTTSNLKNTGEILATGNGNIDIKGDLENTKKIATGKALNIKANEITNKAGGTLQAAEDLDVQIKNGFTNENTGKVLGGNIIIDGSSSTLNKGFVNNGEILSNGKLTVDLGKNQVDITLNDTSKMSSQDTMKLVTGGNIVSETRFQNYGSLDFSAGKNITNKGMMVSNGNISLTTGGTLTNEAGTTIWAAKDLIINAAKNILNKFKAAIESKGNMTLTGESLINEAGTIKAGKNLNINVNKLENKSNVTGSGYVQTGVFESTEKYRFQTFPTNKYEVIKIEFPVFESNLAVTDKATIQSGGNLSIKGKDGNNSNVTNLSGTISAKGNIDIKGDLKNETKNASMTVDEYFSKVKITLGWEERTAGLDLWMGEDTTAEGNLKNLLRMIVANPAKLNCFKQLANNNNDLKNMMSSAFGPDWMAQSTLDMNKYNGSAKYQYFAANGSASILAGGSFNHSGGRFENIGGESGGNKNIDVNIGDNTVNGTQSNLEVSVSDPNSITEVAGVKQVHEVEIQKGEVTINGVTITASTGGTVTSIAIAGTINPVIFIDIPIGENGIFKPALPRPNGTVPYKYETNLDFIDLSKYYGSNYFFDQAGYDPGKTSTVIGDAYYEKELINTSIREGLGYAGEIGTDQIKSMLDNAVSVKDGLGLELGKPLTPDQINNLEKDIIWYVEMEVEGDIVLVPQVYFSKDTRLKIAGQDQGGGTGSVVKAGGDINIDATDVVNSNGNISGGGNIDIKSESGITNNASGGLDGGISGGGNVNLEAKENIDMIGGSVNSGGDVSVKAEGNINIESTLGYDENGNQVVSNSAGVQGSGDISINAGGDTTIKGGVIESTGEGDIELSGKNVNILDQNLVSSSQETTTSETTTTTTSSSSSTSSGSTVAGNNVTIKAENDVNIKGSDVIANENVSIDAKNDVNIVDGQDYTHQETSSSTSGFVDGLLTVGQSQSETTTSKSKGSTVGGLGGVDIKSGGDTTLKGSDLIAGDNGINIESSGDVNIIDGQDTVTTKSSSNNYNVIGFTSSTEETKSSTSKGSSLTSIGDINIESGGNVKVVGSDLTSLGDTNISAENDVKFEAGKNTYESKKSSVSVGVTSTGAKAGLGGNSAEASWDPHTGGSTEIVDGDPQKVSKNSQNKTSGGKFGKNYMDSLTSVQTTVGVSVNNSSEKSTTWTEGNVTTGGNLNIKSKGTTDIGGADFTTGGDFTIEAKDIETTKYTDVIETESTGVTVGVKGSNTTTSNVADAVNKGMQIADSALDSESGMNEALTGAQVGGTITNMIFGDILANTSSLTGEIGYNDSKTKSEKENITSIKSGGNVNFKTTSGDINLKGVNIDGEGVNLDSAGNVNITDAKETYTESSKGVNVSGGVTYSAGVSAIDGGNTQVGVVGNVHYNQTEKNNELSHGSSINAKNVTIKSEKDTNVIGSNVTGDNVNLDVKGNLNVETVKDKINESHIEGWGGGDLSVGVATNTIVTGDFGASAGGGEIYKKGDLVNTQAGITAKNNIDVKVGGDANIIGGSIGSETGEGNLNIGGNLNIQDVKSDLEAGGEIIGVNAGTKGGGIQGEVGDIIDLEKTGKGTIGLNSGNVTIGGDVTINGQEGTKEEINSDMKDSLTVDKDVKKAGGTFSGTVSKIPNKKKKGSYDVTDNETPDIVIEHPPVFGKINSGEKATIENTHEVQYPDLKIPRPDVVITPPLKTDIAVSEDVKKPETGTAEVIPPKIKPDIVIDSPPKTDIAVSEDVKKPETGTAEVIPPKVVNGYVKNPETGKWEKLTTDIGAVLTGGAITNKKALDGIKDGLKSLIDPNYKPNSANKENTGVKIPVPDSKQPVTQGNYQKNPETGKWEPKK